MTDHDLLTVSNPWRYDQPHELYGKCWIALNDGITVLTARFVTLENRWVDGLHIYTPQDVVAWMPVERKPAHPNMGAVSYAQAVKADELFRDNEKRGDTE